MKKTIKNIVEKAMEKIMENTMKKRGYRWIISIL